MSGRNLLDALPPDALARLRKRTQPKWVAPMLATLTDEVFSRPGWFFEPKWDGERCLAFRRGRSETLFAESNSAKREISGGGRSDSSAGNHFVHRGRRDCHVRRRDHQLRKTASAHAGGASVG